MANVRTAPCHTCRKQTQWVCMRCQQSVCELHRLIFFVGPLSEKWFCHDCWQLFRTGQIASLLEPDSQESK